MAEQHDPREFLDKSHELALWMIQLADTKASILTALSVGLAGLLFIQAIPSCNDAARYVLLVAVGLALLSTFACLETVFPRTAEAEHGSFLYYRTIRKLSEPEYFKRVTELTKADADRHLSRETWELARTQELKYMWLWWAIVLFVFSLIPAAIGLIWSHLPCTG